MRSLRPGGGGAELTGGAKLARRCSAVPPSERHLEPAKRATAIRTRPSATPIRRNAITSSILRGGRSPRIRTTSRQDTRFLGPPDFTSLQSPDSACRAGRGALSPVRRGGPRVGRGTKRWRHSRAVLRSSVSIGVAQGHVVCVALMRACRGPGEKGRRSRRMCPAGASRFRHPRSRTGPRRRTNQTMEIPLSLAKESERRRDPAAEAGRAGRAFPGGEMK